MLRTVQSLPLAGPLTLGFDPARFQTEPPVCYRASWQLPGPDFHRLATTSTNTKITSSRHEAPPVLLGARKPRARGLAGHLWQVHNRMAIMRAAFGLRIR